MNFLLDIYNYRILAEYIPQFYEGLWATLKISFVALFGSLAIGTVFACLRLTTNPLLWRLAASYVQAIRSTPLLVQIYVIYFALPDIPILDRRLNELEGGILALALNAGAYMGEIIRAGIQSVSKGQIEGAMSLGMTYIQRMRHVVLPQAFARVIPPLLGQTAVLIKDSSLVSFIGVFELFSAGVTVMTERLIPTEAFITVALGYLAIYLVLLLASNGAQRRLAGAGNGMI
jgi:polar amino acid transport system permease protein